MTKRFLLLGAGYSARAFAARLKGRADIEGTRRNAEKASLLEATGITPLVFDGTAISPELADALRCITHLVVSAAPSPKDPLLGVLRGSLKDAMPALRWVGYLSTVGVYGNHDGAWVTEESACLPRPGRSDGRLAAEQAWTAAGHEAGVPVALLRLSGIYGPGRNAFANLAAGTARRIVKPGQIFNRIHVADIAGALDLLAEQELDGPFNVSDDEPSPPQDVVAYAAGLMGVEPPPEIAFDEAEMTPMARSFYGETKRIANAKLKAAGYVFQYPNYRTAFETMWREGNWR
ncbi:MAG TPA: SDR family oxidoreductase [Rhizobiaceae bacterium]|nr:SDR family oxidoreductase [Rhizobiaceae bacterium]